MPAIAVVAEPMHAAAAELLVGRLPPEDRCAQADALLEALRRGEVPADGLLGAWRGDELVGAVFAQLQPGRTAVVWLPGLVEGEPPATSSRLLRAATDWLSGREVRLAQVILADATEADRVLMAECGYGHLADLLYLVCLPVEFPRRPPDGPLEFEPCREDNYVRLAAVVEATYRQSLDCPALDGLRPMKEVLEGYRSAGACGSELWRIACHEGRDVGCLLVADHPEQGNCELVYMGVVPAARGRCWGEALARLAQWLTRQAGRDRLVLAVDAENEPAIRVYAAAGFQAWDRRTVFARFFRPAG
jgi:mycothiol synthase